MKLVHIVCAYKHKPTGTSRCGSRWFGGFCLFACLLCFVSRLNLTGGNAFPFWPFVHCIWAAEAALRSLSKESYFQRWFSSHENKSVLSRPLAYPSLGSNFTFPIGRRFAVRSARPSRTCRFFAEKKRERNFRSSSKGVRSRCTSWPGRTPGGST